MLSENYKIPKPMDWSDNREKGKRQKDPFTEKLRKLKYNDP